MVTVMTECQVDVNVAKMIVTDRQTDRQRRIVAWSLPRTNSSLSLTIHDDQQRLLSMQSNLHNSLHVCISVSETFF